jgi:predicted ATPase/DNA-binding CsgD family transcriptional regulator
VSVLQSPLSSFVGRSAELGAVAAALSEHRLVTVTGVGGCGKTRLAQEAARREGPRHRDGVRMVPLAPVATPEGLVAAIAAAMGTGTAPQRGDELGDLTAAIGGAEALLLLDNCEHLRAGAAAVVDHLVRSCPSLTVLATSREPLRLEGEQVIGIDPLPVDPCTLDEPSAAVQLFVERASSVRPGFVLEAGNLDDVLRACRCVDGIALAVELAAARAAHLSPAEIAARLELRPGAMSSRQANATERHFTLASTLDWSYDLLAAEEQEVFRRLGVFVRGTVLPAVEAVCAPAGCAADRVLELVASLVDKSLVVAEQRPGATRYRMLDTVRRYAAERLEVAGEASETRRRHAVWLTRQAHGARVATGRGSPGPAGIATGDDVDDVVAALAWADGAGEQALALRLAAATWKSWEVSGRHAEGRRLLGGLVGADRAGAEPGAEAEHARVLVAIASLALTDGEYGEARATYERAIADLERFGEAADLAGALNALAVVALYEDDPVSADELAHRSLRRFELLGDHQPGAGFANSTLGIIAARRGDEQAAGRHFLDALGTFRRLGLKGEAASVLNNLGNLSADGGDPHRATRFYEGALQLQREIGDDRGAALSLNNLSLAAQRIGDLDHAGEHAEAARVLFRGIGDRLGEAATDNNLANLEAEQGRPAQALALYARSAAAFREAHDVRRLATALHNLADVADGVGDRQLAWDRLLDAVSLWNQMGAWEEVRTGMGKLAELAACWRVPVGGWPEVPLDGPGDPVALSHALESARWAPVPPAPQPSVRHGQLTPREAQVVALVGRALSNAEIGAELFISERTVESHVAAARAKLGVDSRTKLARWAIGHGLADS